MNRHLLFNIFLFIFFGASQGFCWSYRLGSSTSDDQAAAIVATQEGGFAIAGITQRNSNSQTDIILHRLRPNGSIRWQRQIGDATNWDSVSSIFQTRKGEFFITGNRMASGREYDAFFALFSADGNILWQKTIGGINWDGALTAEQTKDGGYIVAGYYGRLTGLLRHSDGWLIKLDSHGDVEWHRTIELLDEFIWSIHQTYDGGFIATGQTIIPGRIQNDDGWILKFNSEGIIQWKKILRGLDFEVCMSVIEKSKGGYIVAGRTASFGKGGFDVWVISLSSDGKIEWQKTYGGRYNEEALAIVETSDLNFVVAANTKSFGAGNSDIWILKLDSDGNVLWQKAVGTSEEDLLSAITVNKSGIIIAGSSISSRSKQFDVLIVRMNQKGEIGKSCLSSVDTAITPHISRAKVVSHSVIVDSPPVQIESISMPIIGSNNTPQRTCESR